METITGGLSKINPSLIKRLFPHLSQQQMQSLQRSDNVDIRIGVAHASRHPERVERAKGKGDFWLYRGHLGICLGGSYPGIEERTHKSDELFHVNQKYHVGFSSCSYVTSYELVICNRVESFHTQRGASVEVVDSVDESSSIIEVHSSATDIVESSGRSLVEPRSLVSGTDVVTCNTATESSSMMSDVDGTSSVSSGVVEPCSLVAGTDKVSCGRLP